MQEKIIYLLRHGSILSDSREEHRYIGHLDLPLSKAGIFQAEKLRDVFAKYNCSTVYCSDLRRSVETAAIIAKKISAKPIIKKNLREINMGIWEGKTFKEIALSYPDEFAARGLNIAEYRIPGGETFLEAQKRIVAEFSAVLSAEAGNLIIVGHAGINRLLLCKLLNVPIANMFRFCQDYGCVNILIANQQQYRIKLLNGMMVNFNC